MADDTQQIDYDALSKDTTFRAMHTDQQRAYLSAVDKDFSGLDPESQKGYIAHLTGVNLGTPTAKAVAEQPEGQLRLRNDLNLPPDAKTADVSNAYQRESGKFAGAAAGAMVGGAAPTLLLRAAGTGGASAIGASAGGASPREAAETGATAAVLQPAGELAVSALSTVGKKLLAPAADKLGDFWSNVTGYTKALENAKSANLARYQLAEQKASQAIDAAKADNFSRYLSSEQNASQAIEAAKADNYSRYLSVEQKASQAVTEGQANLAAVKAAQPQGQLGNWSDLNQSIGTSAAKTIRIGKGSADISNAYGIPGRGLEAEGFTKEGLQKMTPPEQASAIGPRFQAAGKAVQATADKATEQGVTLDAGKSVFNIIKDRIKDPSLQEKAIEIINSHQRELGIDNIRQATPTQALALRQALRNEANFGANASIDSLKGVGRAIYSAVSSDLHDAVPGMKTVDMHYGDLAQAVDTVRQNTGKYMAGKWTPPQTAVQKAEAAVPELPKSSPYTPLPGMPNSSPYTPLPQMPNSSPYTPLPASNSFTSDALRKVGAIAGVGGGLIGSGFGGYALLRRLRKITP